MTSRKFQRFLTTRVCYKICHNFAVKHLSALHGPIMCSRSDAFLADKSLEVRPKMHHQKVTAKWSQRNSLSQPWRFVSLSHRAENSFPPYFGIKMFIT